jgi:nitrite reductase/ring-hydroxylating ferredoxin subunit
MAAGQRIALCPSAALAEGAPPVVFSVCYLGRACRAFAIRHEGRACAYLNRCTHVPVEMNDRQGRFFDDTGRWLRCAVHGALYQPDTGDCVLGPCRGGLLTLTLSEEGGMIHWHTAPLLQPLE